MATESKLKQTNGTFTVAGIVSRIDNEFAYREGLTGSGVEYQSYSFDVQTSPTNTVTVELFGMVKESVYPYSSTIAAEEKKKGNKNGGKLVLPWAKRFQLPDTYHLIGTDCYLEKGEDGKYKKTSLTEYDAVSYIRQHLKNGDSVRIVGEPMFSRYKDKKTGEMRTKVAFSMNKLISKIDPIKFDADDFEPVNSFSQEIVIDNIEDDPEAGVYNVYARTIQYGGKWTPTIGLVLDKKNEDTKNQKFIKLASKWQFGDFVNVSGLIKSGIVTENVTDEADEEEDAWGTKPKGQEKVVKQKVFELVITSADRDSYQPKMYGEDDFATSGVTEEKPNTSGGTNEKLPWE